MSGSDSWDDLTGRLAALRLEVQRSKAVNVNREDLREQARSIVQSYFRIVRLDLLGIGVEDEDLVALDDALQQLLALSQGRNLRSSYVKAMSTAARAVSAVALLRERKFGERGVDASSGEPFGELEQKIYSTLLELIPGTARSYEQAVRDLRSDDRVSYRGTAAELREVVREALNHLAPDEALVEAGVEISEAGNGKPTMKEKTRFILQARGLSRSGRKAQEDAVSALDEFTESFVRSTYTLGSKTTHTPPTKTDVNRLKMYVDVALAELLQIH